MTDLKIAIEKVDSEAIHGVNCPCCGTYVKEWKKPIVSTAAGSLVNLVAFYKDEPKFYHLDDFTVLAKDRNFSQLVLWGLVEAKPCGPNEIKRGSGMYKPTDLGIKFVDGVVKVKKFVHTRNNMIVKFSGVEVGINDVIKEDFSYRDLLLMNF